MIHRKSQKAAGRLCHRDIRVVHHAAHARAADNIAARLGRTAGRLKQFPAGDADRDLERARRAHRAANGHILFNHLFARRGVRHIEQGARVADDRTNVQRQAAGRYDASRHLVNDLLFVACRIIFAQQVQPELPKRFDRGAQSLDRAFIVLFQRDDALLRAGLLHH